jgi:hypothetical protein
LSGSELVPVLFTQIQTPLTPLVMVVLSLLRPTVERDTS